jgi:hypothetical protein
VGDQALRIGYSFWGFLGDGIVDTPDGGRCHRRTLVDGLIGLGHEVVFLQTDRDRVEAGERLPYIWDAGLPDINVLFLEWRWQIPSRNDTPCGTPGHTCDLHRQEDLVRYYTMERGVRTVVWDKDQQLRSARWLRALPNVTVCEAALFPRRNATQLLFPVDDHALDAADPVALARLPRDLPLVYVGNQYGRDEAFSGYFAPVAATVEHRVAGKWPNTSCWPHINFTGRLAFPEVAPLYRRSVATILLAPPRYAIRGQFTTRLFEAVLAGCLPIGTADLRGVETFLPSELIVRSAAEAATLIDHLRAIAGTPAHASLIRWCLDHLAPFRLSHQLTALNALLEGP